MRARGYAVVCNRFFLSSTKPATACVTPCLVYALSCVILFLPFVFWFSSSDAFYFVIFDVFVFKTAVAVYNVFTNDYK